VFEKYKICVIPYSDFWIWLSCDVIYTPRFLGITFYDINNEYIIDINNRRLRANDIPYWINKLLYVFLNSKILITDSIKNNKISNNYKIVHYNRVLDLFVNNNLDVYVQQLGSFVEFKFTGDYERDYNNIPQNICTIVDYLLELEFVYDIVNEIYRHLLKLDQITSLVY